MMPMNLSLNQSSSAKGSSNSGFDNSGFSVNFGSGSAGGSGIPSWAIAAGVAVAVYLIVKSGKR